jgi:ubiquitin thioesterase protein OTUB1
MEPTTSTSVPVTNSNPENTRSELPPDLADLTDEQISTLTQEITDSYTKDVPLVGPLLPISVLVDEFKNNEPFRKKISGLAEKWGGFRRTARNGNCFYQAFAYAWIDSLQRLGVKRIQQEIQKIQNTVKTLEDAGTPLSKLVLKLGFEKLAYEDFLEATLTLLQSLPITKSPSLVETLKYFQS